MTTVDDYKRCLCKNFGKGLEDCGCTDCKREIIQDTCGKGKKMVEGKCVADSKEITCGKDEKKVDGKCVAVSKELSLE